MAGNAASEADGLVAFHACFFIRLSSELFLVVLTITQNPRLVDTAAVLCRSNTHLVAAQMAAGILPVSTTLDNHRSIPLIASERRGNSATSSSSALVEREAEAASLVPTNTTVDALLLQQAAPTGVVSWGPRPAENSPFDQLILHNPDEGTYASVRLWALTA